jgi:carboxylesterase type B
MYGGAMVTGSSSIPELQGNNFAKKDVIMVSLNTRESIYAYPFSSELHGTSQNFGLLDFEKGMEWIHDNIQGIIFQGTPLFLRARSSLTFVAAFGGDPDHIVIGGHSSGSVHVSNAYCNIKCEQSLIRPRLTTIFGTIQIPGLLAQLK